ncbi:hypothetical protein [Woodsholea maritima]|uniref:hypothetical protein n=1 Tax=Woodsholea maritima TaxID=240237 RepID=UPI000475C872|nr:hypothetical protein [Woodsholea maritima]
MTQDTPPFSSHEDPLMIAEARLNQAIDRVAMRMRALEIKAAAAGDVASDEGHQELVAALEAAHGREDQLSQVAQEASQALGIAIQELQNLKAQESAPNLELDAAPHEEALDER